MFLRSDFRLVAYRKKNKAALPKGKEWIAEEIEKVMLPKDKWEDFSVSWDLFVSPKKVSRIVPEVDEVYVNNACIEIKTKLSLGMSKDELYESLTDRQKNIYDTVCLNYLGEEVDWETYNDTWAIKIDQDAKRIEVYSKKTKKNEVVFPKPPTITPVAEAVKSELAITEKGSVDNLDPKLLDKLKAFLASEKE